MGWTTLHKDEQMSVRQFFEQEFKSMEILDCAVVKLRTAYIAARHRKGDQGEVFALICKLDWYDDGQYNFGYKDMDETQGPCESECPERILRRLTPTTHKYALEWRERCAAFHAEKAARLVLSEGVWIAPAPDKQLIFSGQQIGLARVVARQGSRLIIDAYTDEGRYIARLRCGSAQLGKYTSATPPDSIPPTA